MKYKALISDLDGTIIRQSVKDGLPSKKVIQAIEKARSKIHIGIATGRPPPYVDHLFEHLKLSGPSILLNGALIVDSATRKVLYSEPLSKTDFTNIIAIMKKMKLHYTIDEVDSFANEDIDDYIPKKPLVVFAQHLTIEQVGIIQNSLNHLSAVTATQVPDWNTNKWALNICNVRATKLHAVVKVADILGISPKEIIAVGDNHNDFPLLMACGLKVAMGNAVPELKDIADFVAPSIDEDGMVTVLDKFVFKGNQSKT